MAHSSKILYITKMFKVEPNYFIILEEISKSRLRIKRGPPWRQRTALLSRIELVNCHNRLPFRFHLHFLTEINENPRSQYENLVQMLLAGLWLGVGVSSASVDGGTLRLMPCGCHEHFEYLDYLDSGSH